MLEEATRSSVQWRLTDGQLLRHRQWGDECVLFNNVTGDTHLLDMCGLNLLLCLQNGQASADSLEDAIAATMKGTEGDDAAAFLFDLLSSLESAGLVERDQC